MHQPSKDFEVAFRAAVEGFALTFRHAYPNTNNALDAQMMKEIQANVLASVADRLVTR